MESLQYYEHITVYNLLKPLFIAFVSQQIAPH